MSDIRDYKCPCCAAPLMFDANTQNLHCDACNNTYDVKTLELLDEEEAKASKDSQYDWNEYEARDFSKAEAAHMASYTCPSCAAEITGDDTIGATICPYCGNAAIIKKTFEGALRPDYMIPFRLDKKAAMAAFEAACKKAPFLPDVFKEKRKIEEMTGIYVPFWMFDCDCSAAISYSAQRVTMWSDTNYHYTKTDYYRLIRQGEIGFENIPVDGAQKIDNVYTESVEPFRYADAVEFDSAYLSGFLADKYDVSAEDSKPRANERVKASTEDAFRETTMGYTAVLPEKTSVQMQNGKIRYALLPLWMLNIQYQGKIYKFAINGQTGKVAGEYPVCKKKKWRFFGIVWAISLVVVLLILWLYIKNGG